MTSAHIAAIVALAREREREATIVEVLGILEREVSARRAHARAMRAQAHHDSMGFPPTENPLSERAEADAQAIRRAMEAVVVALATDDTWTGTERRTCGPEPMRRVGG